MQHLFMQTRKTDHAVLNVQADLSLHCVHMLEGTFCQVTVQICFYVVTNLSS